MPQNKQQQTMSQLSKFQLLMKIKLVTGNTLPHTSVSLKRFKREAWERWELPTKLITNQQAQLTLEVSMMLSQMSQLPETKSWIKLIVSSTVMLRCLKPYCLTSHLSMSQQSQHHNNSWPKLISCFGQKQRKWRAFLLSKRPNKLQVLPL